MRLSSLLCAAAVLVTVLGGCSDDGSGAAARPSSASAAPEAADPAAATAPSPSRLPSPVASPSPAAPSPAPPVVVARGDGALAVVPGTSATSGPGRPTPYLVEVEGGLGIDTTPFVREVERVLADPRSWGAGGRRALQRVDRGDVVFRVALASPETTDRLCAPLRTNGRFSCANGERAVLNAGRWLTGADTYAGQLGLYREYLVNHEVGHTLGRGHEPCPGAGQPAPVMVQQTKSLYGCTQNTWPYP